MRNAILTPVLDFKLNSIPQLWVTIVLLIVAPALTVITYFALQPIEGNIVDLRYILALDLVYVLFVTVLVVRRIVRIISEHRAKSAGAKLHLRLTALFGILAFVPTVLVAVFAIFTVNQALEGWFSERVRTAVGASLEAAEAYKFEQKDGLEKDTALIARALNRERMLNRLPDGELRQTLAELGPQLERGMKEIFIINQAGNLIARGPNSYLFNFEAPSVRDYERAAQSPILIEDFAINELRALFKLSAFPNHYIYVAREVDGALLNLLTDTAQTAIFYQQLQTDRDRLLFDFGLLYLIFAVILIMTATWVGLWFAERLSKPIGALADAAIRVGAGDLDAKVSALKRDDEIALLGDHFNQMTDRLKAQRDDLIENANTAERRRRLFDSVLSSITSGVIGLDINGQTTFINRSAHRILMLPEGRHTKPLAMIVPEFEAAFETLKRNTQNVVLEDIKLIRGGKQENILARLATRKNEQGDVEGYVIAFEDMTDLVSAQRMAAWGDVARRIAHEIKNPLTPIRLSAERIKRKFTPQVGDNAQQLDEMTSVIVRQTDDLRRIVDEFSKFARMPAPDKKRHSLLMVIKDALVMQKTAQHIEFTQDLPAEDIFMFFDATLIKQAMINLLKNATESVIQKLKQDDTAIAHIHCQVTIKDDFVQISICDTGLGLPPDRARLFEPYVTHRQDGTGLGLPIVLKIIEDHGGSFTLDDYTSPNPPHSKGAQAIIRLPIMNTSEEDGS